MRAFGDSITVGVGASTPEKSWIGRLLTNKAVSGSQAADVGRSIQQADLTGQTCTLFVGTNDHRTYKNDPAKMEFFRRFFRQCVAWLVLENKVKARDMQVSGSWNNTVVNTFGRNTTTAGSKAETTVDGTSVFVGYIVQNSTQAGGVAVVRIDGDEVGQLNSYGAINTVNGLSYGSACAVFNNLREGSHTVEIEVVSGGKVFYLDFIAGNASLNPSAVIAGNIPKMSGSAYSTYGTSEENVIAYNSMISDVLAEFGITPLDVFAAIDPAIHLSDGIHPNDAGHEVLCNLVKGS